MKPGPVREEAERIAALQERPWRETAAIDAALAAGLLMSGRTERVLPGRGQHPH